MRVLVGGVLFFLIFGIGTVSAAHIPIAYSIDQPIFLVGTEEIVFDWSEDRCLNDSYDYDYECEMPDHPARAFRDADGNITLLATHAPTNVREFGPDFDNLEHQCDAPIFEEPGEEEPSQYNDRYWPTSPWIDQSTNTVYMLYHMEYWGSKHRNISNCTDHPWVAWLTCSWWSFVSAKSTDGGANYALTASAPDHLIATIPYTYVPNQRGATGYGASTNIFLDDDGYYYVFYHLLSNYQEQKTGYSLMRTADVSDPSGWRLWNGTDFSIKSVNPYTDTFDPAEKVAHPLFTGIPGIKSIGEMKELNKYILITNDPKNFTDPETGKIEEEGVAFFHLSDDLFHWGPGIPFRIDRDDTTLDTKSLYDSLIDHASTSPNFETIEVDGEPHLYFVTRKYIVDPDNPGKCERDLGRSPLQFVTWNELQNVLGPLGFMYYGLDARNRPAIGNILIDVIADNVDRITFFSELESGGIRYDHVEGTNRFGIQGSVSRMAYLQPKVGFGAWSFANANDYQTFLDTGSTSGGMGINPLAFDFPFSLNTNYGFRAHNVPPTQDQPELTSASGLPGDTVTCTPQNMDDYEGDTINPVTTFQVKGDGESEFTGFEQLAISFDVDRELPRLVDFEKIPYSSILDYAGFDNIVNKQIGAMPQYVPGAIGGAYEFTGTEIMMIENKEGLDLVSGQDFSIEFWVKTDQSSLGGIFFYDEPEKLSTFSYAIGVNGGKALLSFDYGGSPFILSTESNVNDGEFHHVAFVADTSADEIRVYVDGGPDGNIDWTGHTGQVVEHYIKDLIPLIGTFDQYDSINDKHYLFNFVGTVDELRIYHHALTEEMITAHVEKDYSFVSGEFVEALDTWRCEVTLNDGGLIAPSEQSGGLGISSGTFCGDETCDPDEDGDSCYQDCGECGDGDQEGTEECDDGNQDSGDGCSSSCMNENCEDGDGDGYTNETCGGSDCNDNDGDINPVATEICGDGIDQDCSGGDLACPDDECTSGNTRICDTGLLGKCLIGDEECVDGEWSGTCDQTVFPDTEVCDGYDNDCDGQEDEGGVCICSEGEEQKCGSNIGICEEGKRICTNNQWSDCVGGVRAKSQDICGNNLDDDCDTEVDEGCDFFGVTCFNGAKDTNEEGVDCGGVCPRECLGFGSLYLFIVGIIIFLAALILILNISSNKRPVGLSE